MVVNEAYQPIGQVFLIFKYQTLIRLVKSLFQTEVRMTTPLAMVIAGYQWLGRCMLAYTVRL